MRNRLRLSDRRPSDRRRRHRGTELLELALVLGVILLPIMFGTIEFGTYFYFEHNLQAAAREAARAACVVPQEERLAVARDAAMRVLEASSITQFSNFDTDDIAIDWEDVTEDDVTMVTVTVHTTWDKVPQAMRPMNMIRDADEHPLRGYAAMREEFVTGG